MKNGLSYFQTGGVADTPDEPTVVPPTGAAAKKIPLGPTDTANILANMQQMIDSRQGPMATFNRGLERAAAWGSGGIQGPSEALNRLNQQQAAEEKSTFEMRQQMAAYRAAQERQRRGAETLGFGAQPAAQPAAQPGMPVAAQPGAQPAAQPAYLDMINSLPASVRPGAMLLLQNGEFDKFSELVSAHEIKRPDIQKNLAYSKSLPPQDGDIFNRQVFEKAYQPQTYVDAEGRSFQYSLPQAMPPEMRTQPRPAAPAAGGTLSQIQNSVFQTESSGGKADTSKPGVQGAIGPMQITQDTWNTNTARGVIPKNLDINNPRDNKLAGDKLLEHYYNKFGGDVDKTLAAYHGGEGAINPDGTINTNRKDANGMTIGNYIAKNKAQIAPTQEAPQRKSVGEQEVEKAGSLESSKVVGKEIGALASEIKTLGKSSFERETRYQDILDIVNDKDMQKAFGKLSAEGFVPFVLRQLESGAGIGQFGTLGLTNLERNATIASLPKQQRDKFLRVEKHLKQAELEYARIYLQGQGAVSDNERRLVQQATGSTSDPVAVLKIQAGVMRQRAVFDKQMAEGLDKYRDKFGTYADPDKFFRSNEAKEIIRNHNAQLQNVLGVKVPLDNNPLQAPPSAQETQPRKNVSYKVIK
jgi:hypothetical protein